ncbi:SCO family protein [Spirosoma sp. BT702]|uniref:SCO family protein n=1 Tax=Spirosoma profusum TaxID=2771354 RepID=A0A926XYI8_9BACT|nr:SCO family protein [Spirosoma profusum]MBD2702496.1 SCO family protein [Spirosoma profusum]
MFGIRSLLGINLLALLMGSLAISQITQQPEQVSVDETVPYYNTPDFTPIWVNNSGDVAQKITHYVADFSFRDQTNNVVTQKTVTNKVHVANFFFTSCPSICPKMTNLLKTVQDTFKHEPNVVLLSYSVTPWLDSVTRLRRYADTKGVMDNKWHLLTGERGKIYDLARRSYFAEEAIGFTKDSTEFLHTEHLILVDQNRRIRGVYNGTISLDIDKLITDISILLKEN